jgi:hypothetical protein
MAQEINTIVLKQLREDSASSLSAIEKKFGIKLSIGTIRFNAQEFSAKLSGILVEKGAEGISSEEIKYKKALETCGNWFFRDTKLSIKDYGKVFTSRDKKYTFIGIATKRRKFPIVGKSADGKIVLFTEAVLPKIKS